MIRRSTGSPAQELADRTGELADRAADLAARAREDATPYVERMVAEASALVAAASPRVESAADTLSDALEDAGQRGSAAWGALRGDELAVPAPVRRWPWAVGAAVAGAAAGAFVASVLRRMGGSDADGAVDPAEVQAVVDRQERTAPPPA